MSNSRTGQSIINVPDVNLKSLEALRNIWEGATRRALEANDMPAVADCRAATRDMSRRIKAERKRRKDGAT